MILKIKEVKGEKKGQTLKKVKWDKCPDCCGSSILLCHENFVSTLSFNIQLFNFPLLTCRFIMYIHQFAQSLFF